MKTRKRKPTLEELAAESKALAKKHGLKTIDRDKLCRLAYVNSKKLPHHVIDGGVRKHWVGVGWIDHEGESPQKGDVVIVP